MNSYRWVTALVAILIAASCTKSSNNSPQTRSEIAEDYRTTIQMIYNGEITFSGGNGTSVDEAVVISGTDIPRYGAKAQYIWVGLQQGNRGIDWQVRSQQVSREGERQFAEVVIQDFVRGKNRTYWFDISEFYGKK